MALSAATIPTIVGDAILESLRGNLVYSNLLNEDFLGNVAPGNAVKIPAIGSVTVGAYTDYSDMSDEEASDSSQTMDIDQQSYFSIVLSDIDAAMSKPAVLGAYAREAAFQMANTIDGFLATTLSTDGALVADLGTDGTPLEVNSTNVGDTLLLIARKLDDAKIPRAGRVVVVPAWFAEDLVRHDIAQNTANSDSIANGIVARYAGFDVALSHSVPNTAGEAYKIVAGTNLSATMALAINQTETIRHPNQFGDKLRGLAVYGAKVTRPAALAVATVNEAAEA